MIILEIHKKGLLYLFENQNASFDDAVTGSVCCHSYRRHMTSGVGRGASVDDSIHGLRGAVDLARSKGDQKELAQAQTALVKALTAKMLSTGQMDSPSLDEASAVAREAVKNASATRDSLTEALALNSVGQLLMLAGETAEPLRCFERALAIYVRIGNNHGAATTCSGLAGVCVKTGDYARASEVLRQAIRHSMTDGDLEAVAKYRLALEQLRGVQGTLSTEPLTSGSPGLFGWYFEALKKYATFKGRASRAEFWSFTAVNFLIFFVLAFIEGALGINNDPNVFVLGGIYHLAILLPALGVTVRRLHDMGQSGWCVLINAVPIVGWLIVLVLLAQKGEDRPNAYGDPRICAEGV